MLIKGNSYGWIQNFYIIILWRNILIILKISRADCPAKDDFVKTAETATYNLGTMQKDEDISLSQNIVVINAYEFKSAYESYQRQNSQMSDIEAKSRVVFDFCRSMVLL